MVKEKEKLSNDEMQNVKRPKLGKLSKVNVRIPLIPITNTVTGSAEETKPSTKPAPAEETKPSTKPAPAEETKPSTKPAPAEETKPSTKQAPAEETKPSTKPASAEETKPSTKPAPAEETKPSTKPAPAKETSEPLVIEDEVINLHPEQTDISTVMKADVDPMNAQLGIFNIIYNYNRRRRSH